MFCVKCGTQLPDGASFCSNCGHKIVDSLSDNVLENQNSKNEYLKKEIETNNSTTEYSKERNIKEDITRDNNQYFDESRDLSSLDVSEDWKKIFEIFDQINVYKDGYFFNKALRKVKYFQRLKVAFCFWAFIFGPFYYFVKKMWLKGFLYSILISFFLLPIDILEIFDIYTLPSKVERLLYIIPSAFFASFAKYDYYLYKRYDIKYIRGFPDIFKKAWFTLLLYVAYILILFGSVFYVGQSSSDDSNFESYSSSSSESSVSRWSPNIDKDFSLFSTDFNGVWANDSKTINVDLDNNFKGKVCHNGVCEEFKTKSARGSCLYGTLNKNDECSLCYINKGHGLV
ncbi:zinc-ribbon domain-containing protein [Succinivibrio sp.]|uniref:zinc-ribbon domain-containing protein n=1 Tax=Succinivibrio sp. TaxID=2053619 RepID=UPI0025D9129F|nr:zinc-ribbon domain-containing protein [Succinivibrio sp.]MBQ9221422.1 zinc-ribbon domain-containing protein [Succinivibrio sp.]